MADLSGNVDQRVVSIDRYQGWMFARQHGDGRLTPVGYADAETWPGSDGAANAERQGNGRREDPFAHRPIQASVSSRYSGIDPGMRQRPFLQPQRHRALDIRPSCRLLRDDGAHGCAGMSRYRTR